MRNDSDNTRQGRVKHKVGFGLVFLIVLLLAILSFVPLIGSNLWWIRILDFPRLQEGVALLILAVPVVLYFRYFRKMAGLALILIVSALSYRGFILFPYFQLVIFRGRAVAMVIFQRSMRNPGGCHGHWTHFP